MKRKSIMKRLAMVGGVILTALCLYAVPAPAAPLPSYVAGGTCGKNAEWTLDTNGNLKVSGTGEIQRTWIEYKDQIRTATIGEGITAVLIQSFENCQNLTTVKLPASLTSISYAVFRNCTNLEEINFPKKLQSIGSEAFINCKNLEKAALPSGLKSLGSLAFKDSGIKEITLPATLEYNKDASLLRTFENCPNLERAVINCSVLAGHYFTNCNNLKSVVISDNTTMIQEYAFSKCTSLENLSLGKNIETIGKGAFYNCDSLTAINLPDSAAYFPGYYDWDAGAFEDCDRLQTVTVGTGIAELNATFANCRNLKTVYFCGDAPNFKRPPFKGCGNLTVYIPEYAVDTSWTASVRNPQGAASINWQTWIPPVSHFAPKAGSAANGASKVTVTWKALSGASKYEVLRKTGTGSYSVIGTTTKTSYTDTTAKSNGMKYTYKIRAIGANNVKSRTSAAMVTVYTARPAIAKIAYAGAGKLTVSYKRNTAATSYQIQYAANSKFTSAKTVTVKSGKTVSATLKSLTKGKKYYIRMRTYKTSSSKNYYSAWSAAKAVTAK